MAKITDKIAWIMGDSDDKLIKLEKVSKTYDIGDVVYNDLKKANLLDSLEGQDVEIEVDETGADKDDASTSGTITKLVVLKEGKASEEDTTKEEPVASVKEETGLVSQEVIVSGVSVEKAGVKLKKDKDNKTWYTLDSTISPKKFKDECTGKTVEINVLPQDNGNDVIKSYIVKEEVKKEEKKEESKEKNSKKTYNKGTGNSIEAQASLKCAKAIVASMVDKDSEPDDVLKMITKIAEHSYQLIQNLKNKEELK